MTRGFEGAVLAIHGGAGTITPDSLEHGRGRLFHAGLDAALAAGFAVWRSGGSCVDMVCAAVAVLEDDPSFNAGRGSVLTAEGRVEMDAALMRGVDRAAGAVAGVGTVRNPVLAARAVMESSPHVLLAGAGAERFALDNGCAAASADWFRTDHRVRQWERQRAVGTVSLSEDNHFGTVGAAARDRMGALAAATSTGGMTNKLPGRIGDAPVIGAGTWSDDATLALSATGHGEYFLRTGVGHAIHARVELLGESVDTAASVVVEGRLKEMGGDGGIVAISATGRAVWSFNCSGMYRGVVLEDGRRHTAILLEDA
ncbi:MAG: isoaspartyl peptidase/L-asparaginase family protein [Armatimonadota bacterium]